MTFPLQSVYDWYRITIRNPKYRWWVILASLAYLVIPFDIVPDFIPVIGQIDDAITLLFTEVSQLLISRVKAQKNDTEGDAKVASADPVDVKAVSID
jgi:uncharacterized membrane protein YkvA (DUF1232 family)